MSRTGFRLNPDDEYEDHPGLAAGTEVASQVHARPEMLWQMLGRGEGDVQYACLGFVFAQTS